MPFVILLATPATIPVKSNGNLYKSIVIGIITSFVEPMILLELNPIIDRFLDELGSMSDTSLADVLVIEKYSGSKSAAIISAVLVIAYNVSPVRAPVKSILDFVLIIGFIPAFSKALKAFFSISDDVLSECSMMLWGLLLEM